MARYQRNFINPIFTVHTINGSNKAVKNAACTRSLEHRTVDTLSAVKKVTQQAINQHLQYHPKTNCSQST